MVPVAARSLPAGTIVAAADLAQSDLPANKLYASTPRTADEIIGKRLSRPVKANNTFNSVTLKTPSVVERNTPVTVLFNRPGIQLVGQGLALESGSEGKAIKVLNPESRTTLVAVITAPGTVTIGDQ